MVKPHVLRTHQKGAGHYHHYLSDGRYVLETRGKGTGAWGPWSLWQPIAGKPTSGRCLHSGSSLAQLLKWAGKNPPR